LIDKEKEGLGYFPTSNFYRYGASRKG